MNKTDKFQIFIIECLIVLFVFAAAAVAGKLALDHLTNFFKFLF